MQVEVNADKAKITASYRRLSKIYHPDLNHEPGAEEVMKAINAAYHILRDDKRRREYDIRKGHLPLGSGIKNEGFASAKTWAKTPGNQATAEEAEKVMTEYMGHLQNGENERAYQLLCLHDRQYVTMESFCKWRQSINKLFAIRDFTLAGGEDFEHFKVDEGLYTRARKVIVSVAERNYARGTTERYKFDKHTVLEYGKWKIFLGYRDLNEIAHSFETLSRRQEEGEMVKRWEEYCKNTCRGLDMLSREGLIKRAESEVYRYRRHGQAMTVALFCVKPAGFAGSEEALGDIIECCAQILAASLREIDIPAYLGQGVFAVLFVEMKKRSAPTIIRRMAKILQEQCLEQIKRKITPHFAFAPYEGGNIDGYLLKLLEEI